MSILLSLLSFLSAELCLCCSAPGKLICANCMDTIFKHELSTCSYCKKPSPESLICANCSKMGFLNKLYARTSYDGDAALVLKAYKFQHKRSVGHILVEALDSLPWQTLTNVCLTYVPTDPSHVRERGFDHAKHLAKLLARRHGLPLAELLIKQTHTRQVGASRHDRLLQQQHAFRTKRPYLIKNADLLLVDDIFTTGATLQEAARVLKQAGAKSVVGLVFARTPNMQAMSLKN